MGTVTAIVSGKGGTGKTTLCAAIASCLAAEGRRVLCIDLDVGLRNLDILLGMTEIPVLPFTEVAAGYHPLSAAAQHPRIPGLFLLTAPAVRPAETGPSVSLQKLLVQARAEFDDILLDAPAGVGAGFSLAVQDADRCLVVATADPASLRDAKRTAELLELQGKPETLLLVNRVRPRFFRQTALTVDEVMDRIGLPLLGLVPEDSRVPLAAADGSALVLFERRGAAPACLRIARRLCGRNVPLRIT